MPPPCVAGRSGSRRNRDPRAPHVSVPTELQANDFRGSELFGSDAAARLVSERTDLVWTGRVGLVRQPNKQIRTCSRTGRYVSGLTNALGPDRVRRFKQVDVPAARQAVLVGSVVPRGTNGLSRQSELATLKRGSGSADASATLDRVRLPQ
jgi:hypothetical protein